VVLAQRGKVVGMGGVALRPGDPVVDIALGGRHAAPRVYAGGVDGLDLAALGGVWPAPDYPAADGLPGVGVVDDESPFGVGPAVGNLSCDLANHRPVPGEVARMIGHFGEGGKVGMDEDAAAAGVGGATGALDEIQEHVGAKLVDGSHLAASAETLGDAVDPLHPGLEATRRQVHAEEVGGTRLVGLHRNPAFFDTLAIAILCVLGVGVNAQLAETMADLAGRQGPGIGDDRVDDIAGNLDGEMDGAVDELLGAAGVDRAAAESVPYLGEFPLHVEGVAEFGLGCVPRQMERGGDLGGGDFLGPGVQRVLTVDVVNDHCHGAIHLGLDMRGETLLRAQYPDPVLRGATFDVDVRKEDGEYMPFDPGYFRIVKVGDDNPHFSSALSAKMVTLIEVLGSYVSYSLTVAGAVERTFTRSELEEGIGCPCHSNTVSVTSKGVTNQYTGIPLWRLVAYVDDDVFPAPELGIHYNDEDFNDALAGDAYEITLVAEDGYSQTVTSDLIARDDRFIIAFKQDGIFLDPAASGFMRFVYDDSVTLPEGMKLRSVKFLTELLVDL